jgi:hypothetical protein
VGVDDLLCSHRRGDSASMIGHPASAAMTWSGAVIDVNIGLLIVAVLAALVMGATIFERLDAQR